ncbi:ornithine cyclodeaminase family protein [Roseobacter sp. GAI101]|uniref:ornithine cyclodeaminase family protein n=1 Tax=Roseobacter sp. (strain GAI101) TaxID=391589 RepID=UPI00018723CF|nr:ornithine cyclodeaminase family protein [Roseobacter sp. GAI101]EEB82410.1 ornithine cyclodeaminase/mu-crystallin [Roseobacter sp. GAI101]
MADPHIITDDQIVNLLDTLDIRGCLERMFLSQAYGRAMQPPQTISLFPDDAGDFITYLGVLADDGVFGAKLSPYIPSGGDALVTAWTVLMSMKTGQPLLLCDSKRLTTERTAATTIIAAEKLARPDSRVLTIVGTGAVGMAHLRYAAGIRNWSELRLASPNALSREDLPKEVKGIPVHIYDNADLASAGADVVMLCTSSGEPVIDAAALASTTLITSISTNVSNAHEIDPALLHDLDVYCDYRGATPTSAGEMKLAAAAGWDAAQIRGDLPELMRGEAPAPSWQRPAFFRSIGLGLEDVAAAYAVLSALRN